MALRRRTDAYWQKRAEQRLLSSERATKKYMAELRSTYAEARRRTVKSLQDIYAAYYKKDEGFDMEALRSIAPTGDIKKFINEMKKLGLKTGLPEHYAGRVSRLRLINAQLKAEAQKVGLAQEAIDKRALIEDFTDSYYRAGFDVAKGLGSTPVGFNGLDQQTVNQVLNAKFEGRNFSSRIWTNTDLLADRLRKTLAVAIANGQGISKTAAEMRRDYNVNRYYAERLIRTESNHFHNSAELEAYKQMGFEKFKYMATLDSRTSDICRDMDGKVFDVSDGIPGENVPPLHPNCRSTIVPYFKEYEPETRLYRDPETGQNKFTYNVPFNDWKASLISHGDTRKQSPKVEPVKKVEPAKNAVRELTKDEKDALEYYVSGDGMDINNYLRSRNGVTPEDMTEKEKELVRNLDSATSQEVKEGVLYRSVDASAIFKHISQNDYEELRDFFAYPETVTPFSRAKAEVILGQKLDRFVDKGFVSTTKDKSIADEWGDFTGSDKPVVLRIKVDKGTKGVDLGFLDVADDPQKEVLLARNQVFNVGHVSYKDGNIMVDVTVSNKSDAKHPEVQPFKTEIGKTASKEVANSFVGRLNDLGQMFPDVANSFNKAGAVIKTNPNMKRSMGFYRYRGNGMPISIEYASSKLKTLEIVESQAENAQKVGWWMPTSKEHRKDQVVTHEFGHAVQGFLVNEERKALIAKNPKNATYYALGGADTGITADHRRRIVEIARKDNPGVSVLNGLSKYGGKNASEFFAEVFANAFCGAPNELGKAMVKFLKEKGVYND